VPATEKITSPGVFTRENDESFLQEGVAGIGAAFVGPFQKGPAFVPVDVTSRTDLEKMFGASYDKYFTPYCADYYLRYAASAKIVRVLWNEGYDLVANETLGLTITGSSGVKGLAAFIAPTHTATTISLDSAETANTFRFSVESASITYSYTASLFEADSNYIVNILGTDPRGPKPAYVQAIFNDFISGSTASGTASADSAGLDFSYSTTDQYKTAETPYIQSQNIDGVNTNLFKFIRLTDGTVGNKEVKIAIYNIKKAGTIPGSDYGQFSIAVRKWDDVDKRQIVYETFTNLTLDKDAVNYLPRVIGDRYGI